MIFGKWKHIRDLLWGPSVTIHKLGYFQREAGSPSPTYSMNRRLAYSGLVASLVIVPILACGSPKGPGDGNPAGAGGSGQNPGVGGSGSGTGDSDGSGGYVWTPDDNGDDFVLGSGGDVSGSGGAIFNGGTRVLTPEQVAELTESECAGFNETPDVFLPTLQLVVDQSLSMGQPPCEPATGAGGAPGAGGTSGSGGGFGGPGGTPACMNGNVPSTPAPGSKWVLSVPPMLAALDAFPDEMAVGMLLFPTRGVSGAGACVNEDSMTPIAMLGAPGSAQRTALADALNNAILEVNTPTHDAFHFGLTESLQPYQGEGAKFMILLTDGAPTQPLGCGPTMGSATSALQPILDEIAAAAADGIKTYILGSPGSERSQTGEDMRPFLSEAAKVGGTGPDGCQIDAAPYCHFDMSASPDFATALADALGQVTTGVVDACTFKIPTDIGSSTETFDVTKTNLIIAKGDGSHVLVIRDDSPGDCTEGWKLEGEQIVLCGSTCDSYKSDAGAEVTLSFGCNAIELGPF